MNMLDRDWEEASSDLSPKPYEASIGESDSSGPSDADLRIVEDLLVAAAKQASKKFAAVGKKLDSIELHVLEDETIGLTYSSRSNAVREG